MGSKKPQINQSSENSENTQSFAVLENFGAFPRAIFEARFSELDVMEAMAKSFFEHEKFHNPFLLKGMDEAVSLIKTALENGDKITVYGDYDCDGITSTVILYSYLEASGGEVDWYIPSRDEGYGLNDVAINKIAKNKTKLLITVDNGISAVEEAKLIAQNEMTLIITDHHTVPSILPEAGAIINPKQSDCGYPFKELAGCGVVLKLITALECDTASQYEPYVQLEVIEQYGDLIAIGTIGDVVELVDENRNFVTLGLKNMQCSENIGLRCLLRVAGLSDYLESGFDAMTVAFILCPRINAAGRFAHAGNAVELLLCENYELASTKASELNTLNIKRVEEERRILSEIESVLETDPNLLDERILFLHGEVWHHGVIGIIASRMVTKFGKPCVVTTIDKSGFAKGSFRNVTGFSAIEALTYCEDLLFKFGGHIGAGGFSLECGEDNENLLAFREKLYKYAKQKYSAIGSMPTAEIVAALRPKAKHLTVQNIKSLDVLSPFGAGNPVPIFYLPDCRIVSKRPLKDGKYTSFNIEYLGMILKILDFSSSFEQSWFNIGDTVDIMVNIDINEYNDVESLSIKVKDIRLSGFASNKSSQERLFAAKDTYERLKRGEAIDPKLYPRITPDDMALKSVYKSIKQMFLQKSTPNSPTHTLFISEIIQRILQANQAGFNYCMLRVILDIFEEVCIIEFNAATGMAKLTDSAMNAQKADLSKSPLLTMLKKQTLTAD